MSSMECHPRRSRAPQSPLSNDNKSAVARDLLIRKGRWHASPGNAVWLSVVALMWGATNPLLKLYSKGVEKIQRDGKLSQFIAEFTFLFFNWKYLLSFLTNQMGSVVYYVTLASADLTLAVPITNSLTFIFTALSSRLLGEKPLTWNTIFGMALVLAGVLLCVLSKVEDNSKS